MKVRRERILVRRKSYNKFREKKKKFGEDTRLNKEQDITTETQATTTESPTETYSLTTETTTETPADTTETILEIISNNPKVTAKELASICGITEDGVAYHIKKLKQRIPTTSP